jgi:lipid II:glycine glycyltransferase (peptidoglycan interpeptide bridge formation enzyme)
MPTVDVEENIKKLQQNIEQMTQEVFRLQGMLSTFQGFKRGGLKQIELPSDPNQAEPEPEPEPATELESIQENPE